MRNDMNEKLLREKLLQYEAPFEPGAWAQMEAMLNQPKKRRGIFWWWLSGVSFAGVIGTLSLLLLAPKQTTTGQWKAINSSIAVNVSPSQRQMIVGSKQGNSESVATVENNQLLMAKQSISINISASSTSGSRRLARGNRISIANKMTTEKKIAKTGKRKTASSQTGSPIQSTHQSSRQNEYSVNEQTAFASINALPAFELTTANEERSVVHLKQDDEAVKLPVKKKPFQYEIGLVSGVGISFTQREFHNQPNWSVGVQQAFRIGKYIAITNGVQYSKTAFVVNKVRNVDTVSAPKSYVANIHSIAIPIGLNVYPVTSKRVSWYLSAGVVNHIKVKEDFDFRIPVANNSFGTLTNDPPIVNSLESFNSLDKSTANKTEDYQLGSKRYFANFYAGSGVEVKLHSKLLINTGVLYQISLSPTGKQQARPMTFGGELGLRYKF